MIESMLEYLCHLRTIKKESDNGRKHAGIDLCYSLEWKGMRGLEILKFERIKSSSNSH